LRVAPHEGIADTYRGIRPLEKRDNVWYCRRDPRVTTQSRSSSARTESSDQKRAPRWS